MYFKVAKMAVSFIFRKSRPVRDHLKRHFGRSPDKFPVISVTFPRYRFPCLAIALSKYIKAPDRWGRLVGIANYESSLTLNELIHPDKYEQQLDGPVHYSDVTLSNGRSMNYAAQGLYLIRDGARKLAVFTTECESYEEHITVEITAREKSTAQKFVVELKRLMDDHSIFRGKVIALKGQRHSKAEVVFKTIPRIERKQVILPEATLTQIEKHTTLFSKHHNLLVARGMHLKRGLLLYGPPGTGKTHTIMHIISTMPERTTVLLNSSNIEYLEQACTMARSLQPATIIIEDVDLIAEERSRSVTNSILYELLNEMDGVAEDSDILFLLSTNRPEILEPALASRPGRVDQAILIPPPDDDCRRRLFDHYGKDIPLAITDLDKLVEATEGASSSFIRELFRRAVLLAANEGEGIVVADSHFQQALAALQDGGPLMSKLLAYNSVGDSGKRSESDGRIQP